MKTSNKYKCISVASVTYAQKALDLLRKQGIDSYIIRQTQNNEYGCARCIKIHNTDLEKATALLKNGGVKMGGTVYDL